MKFRNTGTSENLDKVIRALMRSLDCCRIHSSVESRDGTLALNFKF